jgi:Alpha-L-fucosidase
MMDQSHKPPEHFVHLLASAAARGGNLLLNIGPRGDGTFDPKDRAILDGIGRWMATYGESIRGTVRTPLPVQQWGESTAKGNKIYLHVFDWPAGGKLHVSGVRSPVFGATLLGRPASGALSVRRLDDADVEITVPAAAPDPWDSVVALDMGVPFEGEPGIWLPAAGAPIALHVFDGTLAGKGIQYGDGKAGRDVIQSWTDTASTVSWTVRLTEPARYRVALEYAAPPSDSLGHFEVRVGSTRLPGDVVPTAAASAFATRVVGIAVLAPGTYTLSVRPTSIPNGELMRLRGVVLVPVPAVP